MPRYEMGMCGIAAIFAYSASAPRVAVGELVKINQAMIRRGPDGGNYWISNDSCIGLAHRRLAIIDPDSRANQPMMVDQRYWITFNGEIYNYQAFSNCNHWLSEDTEATLGAAGTAHCSWQSADTLVLGLGLQSTIDVASLRLRRMKATFGML